MRADKEYRPLQVLMLVCLALMVVLLSSCSATPVTPPYQLTYHQTQSGIQAARAGYGIVRENRINGFWAKRDGKHYVHVLIRGPWKTDCTLRHEEGHVRGSRHPAGEAGGTCEHVAALQEQSG